MRIFKTFAIAFVIISAPAFAKNPVKLVTGINSTINRQIVFTPDGTESDPFRDEWRLPVNRKGDCEDIALLKKAHLIKAGFSADDVKLLVVWRSEDKKRSNQSVRFMHVVAYVTSLDLVLDSQLFQARSNTRITAHKNIMPLNVWLAANNATLHCEVADETPGLNIPIERRCLRNMAQLD